MIITVLLTTLLLPATLATPPIGKVSVNQYRDNYDTSTIPQLRHGNAQSFHFGRFQSPEAIQKALDQCRTPSSFKYYRCRKDGRTGEVASTRLGGDWVLAESKQVAKCCTAEEVLAAYLDGGNQKRWNIDKLHDVSTQKMGVGQYRQYLTLKSQRVIGGHTGMMKYCQVIRVDQIGPHNYNAFVQLDPESNFGTVRKPFESLAVNVGLCQVGEDVHVYAAGVFRVNRRVVPNLIVFDASGIAGNMAGKGTLWLSSHFERRKAMLLG